MTLTLMTVNGMYVWRGNGKQYVKQRRTIASIDDHTDGNNRPNKGNRAIDICDDENSNDNNDGDDDHNSNDDADPYNNYSDDDDS